MQSNVLFLNKLEDMFKLVEKNVSVKYTQYLDELELSTALQRIPTLSITIHRPKLLFGVDILMLIERLCVYTVRTFQ